MKIKEKLHELTCMKFFHRRKLQFDLSSFYCWKQTQWQSIISVSHFFFHFTSLCMFSLEFYALHYTFINCHWVVNDIIVINSVSFSQLEFFFLKIKSTLLLHFLCWHWIHSIDTKINSPIVATKFIRKKTFLLSFEAWKPIEKECRRRKLTHTLK